MTLFLVPLLLALPILIYSFVLMGRLERLQKQYERSQGNLTPGPRGWHKYMGSTGILMWLDDAPEALKRRSDYALTLRRLKTCVLVWAALGLSTLFLFANEFI